MAKLVQMVQSGRAGGFVLQRFPKRGTLTKVREHSRRAAVTPFCGIVHRNVPPVQGGRPRGVAADAQCRGAHSHRSLLSQIAALSVSYVR